MKTSARWYEVTASIIFLLFVPAVMATEGDPVELLVPVAMAQLDLQICADTARTFENDEALAQKYTDLSDQLYDSVKEAGWSSDEVAAATVMVLDNRTDLVVSDNDTRKDFRLRNFSGDRCQRQSASAKHYLSSNIPKSE